MGSVSKFSSVEQYGLPGWNGGRPARARWLGSLGILFLTSLAIVGHAAMAVAEEKIKITWWQAWTNNESRTALINAYIRAFEARYPDATVEPVFVSPGQLGSKGRVAIAGGAPPDVLMIEPGDLAALAHAGALAPLDKFVAADKVNLKGFIPGDLLKGRYNGQLLGLPHISGGANDFLIYNKELFANAGLPDRAPATWGDLKQFARKITRIEDGRVTQLGYSRQTANGYTFVPYLYSNGGSILSPTGRQATFDAPEAREVFQLFAELEETMGGALTVNRFFGGRELSDENRNFPFYLGQVGMMEGWQSLFKNIAAVAPTLQFGVGVMPYNDANGKASGHGTSDWGWFYVIPKGVPAERQRAAFRWIAWLTANKDGGATFPMTMGRPAPWMEINRRREYFERNPEWGNVINVLETDVSIPITPVHKEIMSLIAQAQNKVWSGATAAGAALEEAARLAQLKLDEVYGR